jgi:hypothetical protein
MTPEASCPSASRAMQFAPVKMVENAASHSCENWAVSGRFSDAV